MLARLDTREPERLVRARDLMLGGDEGPRVRVRVTSGRGHGPDRAVIEIEGVDSVERAEELRDGILFLRRRELAPAAEGSYLACDLVGMRVVTVSGEELGRVAELRPAGGADLLVVRGGGRERLIPFALAICTRIEPEERLIEVDPPEGLLELDEI